MKMIEVRKNVVKLLKKYPHLRNDDVALVFAYWQLVDKLKLKKPDHPITTPLTIVRDRQALQSDGYFLPTDPEVLKQRRKQKVKMRVWLGYAPEPYITG